MTDWRKAVVGIDATLEQAIATIDSSALQVALVLDHDGRLAGILTDGNVRRAILMGRRLDEPVREAMNTNPTTCPADAPRETRLALMRRKTIHHLPLVDQAGRVVGLAMLDDLVGIGERPNWVVLMAGGLGTRLHPLTHDCPKPLLKVGGKPILETILESFAEQGFRRIFLSVNYKAEMIRDYFGDGARWGVRLEYLQEDERLGTAGALSLLPERPTSPLVVMNGDLLTRMDFGTLLQFHADHRASATMAAREYDIQVPFGVLRLDGEQVTAIEEKPVHRFFVNAGIYALSPEALDHLPARTFFDMPSLYERLIADGQKIVAFPMREYWLDIGRIEEFERAQREWLREAE